MEYNKNNALINTLFIIAGKARGAAGVRARAARRLLLRARPAGVLPGAVS